MSTNLLDYKKNIYSQNGEDGVLEQVLIKLQKTEAGVCCEFGAWDGIYLSNVRNLILRGWQAVLIECDGERFNQLKNNYQGSPRVHCINEMVNDTDRSLRNIFVKNGLSAFVDSVDVLSVDIDGLDYEILENLNISPKVICIEANALHEPSSNKLVSREIAAHNVGQPLAHFVRVARLKGYCLVAYTGNAFFVKQELCKNAELFELSVVEAYENFVSSLSAKDLEWLYVANRGLVEPFYKFFNPLLSRKKLKISVFRGLYLRFKYTIVKAVKLVFRMYDSAYVVPR